MLAFLSLDCGNCGSPDVTTFCGSCANVPYCSVSCLKSDWEKRHCEEHHQGKTCPTAYSVEAEDYERCEDVDMKENEETGGENLEVYGLVPEARTSEIGRHAHRRRRTRRKRGRTRRPKKWVQKVHLHEGSFTAQAKRAGYKSTRAFMYHVLAHPKQYSTTTVRRANLMRTFLKLPRRHGPR
jgi:MYND finger